MAFPRCSILARLPFSARATARTRLPRAYRNLVDGGFEGSVFAVNPKHSIVHGKPCHASLDEVPEDVDLAVIASPARTVRKIIEQCGAKGVHQALIVTDGFGETGEIGRAARVVESGTAARHPFHRPELRQPRQPWRVDCKPLCCLPIRPACRATWSAPGSTS